MNVVEYIRARYTARPAFLRFQLARGWQSYPALLWSWRIALFVALLPYWLFLGGLWLTALAGYWAGRLLDRLWQD